jgi:P pilus assembly chaperone PapD
MVRVPVLALLLAVTAVPLSARQGGIHLSPTTIVISYGETSSSFAVRNLFDDPVTFTVSAFAWTNDAAGEMRVATTDDLIVFPPRLTLGPRETRRTALVGDVNEVGLVPCRAVAPGGER